MPFQTTDANGNTITAFLESEVGHGGRTYKSLGTNNLTGVRSGKIVVTGFSHKNKHGRRMWHVRCDCGKEYVASGDSIVYKQHQSCGCARAVLTGEVYAQRRVFSGYKNSARKRGKSFELTFDEFLVITARPCYYCTDPPSNTLTVTRVHSGEHSFTYSGIDRIDSSMGYTMDNVVPCCILCNQAKNDLTHKQFVAHIHKIARRHPDVDAPNV